MKIKIKIILSFLFALSLIGCAEDVFDDRYTPSLSARFLDVDENKIAFPSNESTQTLLVYSQGTRWQLAQPASWVTANNLRGGNDSNELFFEELKLTATENKSADTARVFIADINSLANDFPKQIPIFVTQKNAEPYISVENSYVCISGKANTYRIHVESNFDWKSSADASWVTLAREGDNLLVSTDENPTNDIKTATIILRGKATATIQIEQAPAGVKTLTDTLNFDNVAATYTLDIEADMSWTATTAQSWIQVSPTRGNIEDKKLAISVTPNHSTEPREGSVYISVGAQKIRIPVIQKGYYFEVGQDSIIFKSHGGVMQIELNTNESWYANIEPIDWLTLSTKSGTKDDKLYITASDNPSVKERETNVHIKTDHYPEVEIPIIQKNRYLSTSLNAISFFGKGGTSELIIIYTDANYTIKQDGNWFTIVHEGDFISVSAPANFSDDWKEGCVTLTSAGIADGELQVVIPVRQSSNKGNFTKETYNTDVDYNLLSSYGLNIDIIRYSTDTDYNSSGVTGINKDNYHENGNIENGQHSEIDKTSPNDRGDYNDGQNTGIDKDNYSNDTNYDNE